MSGAAKRADHGGRTGALPGPPRSGERAVRRGGMRAVAVRYPVASFVVLAFVVSWAGLGAAPGRPVGLGPVVGVDLPTPARGAWPAGGRSAIIGWVAVGTDGGRCRARRRLGAVEAAGWPWPLLGRWQSS